MVKQSEFLAEFLDSDTINALSKFLDSKEEYESSADMIALAFGAKKEFTKKKAVL